MRVLGLTGLHQGDGVAERGDDGDECVHVPVDANVDLARSGRMGVLVDEAYELFHTNPVSALAYVDDIDDSDLFVIGAATKGLQAPGIRVGWLISSRQNVEILSNFSSFGMGGVSHPSAISSS